MPATPPPVGATPPPFPQAPPSSHASPTPEKNTVGLIALVLSIIGLVFACIPGVLIVGWVLLPIAFILAIVSLFAKGKKGLGIAALAISVVGTVVGVIVFFAVAVDAVDTAMEGRTSVSTSDGETISSDDTDAVGGSRDNPLPIGATIENDDWTLTINSVNLDANSQVEQASSFNEPAPDGTTYILVNCTVTYTGDAPDGDTPWSSVDYVTAAGNTISAYDLFVDVPDEIDTTSTLYSGASVSGNIGLAVPVDTVAQGTLAVGLDLDSATAFFAVQ
ncbi:hypothetical protein [Aeromicrobium sp. Sec7.5]|uniref:hypothetical protein n=1 Tax=Aeromicrobium sp. Sec7.5 TaxID=3121276 RepID=UPI002FE45D3B